jgi:hypothetical protein
MAELQYGFKDKLPFSWRGKEGWCIEKDMEAGLFGYPVL